MQGVEQAAGGRGCREPSGWIVRRKVWRGASPPCCASPSRSVRNSAVSSCAAAALTRSSGEISALSSLVSDGTALMTLREPPWGRVLRVSGCARTRRSRFERMASASSDCTWKRRDAWSFSPGPVVLLVSARVVAEPQNAQVLEPRQMADLVKVGDLSGKVWQRGRAS